MREACNEGGNQMHLLSDGEERELRAPKGAKASLVDTGRARCDEEHVPLRCEYLLCMQSPIRRAIRGITVVIRLTIRSITEVSSGHQWSSEASLRCEYLCQVALYAVEGTPLSPQPPLGGCLIQPVDQDACMPAEERLTKHAALRSRLRSQSKALSEAKSMGSSVIKGSSVSAHLT